MSTKIHATVDALGNPIRLFVNSSHAPEHGQANALIEGFDADYVSVDKEYDSDRFIEALEEAGVTAVIPLQRNCKKQRKYDRELHSKESNWLSVYSER